MTSEMLRSFFLWNFIINYVVLIFWFLLLRFAFKPLKEMTESLMGRKVDSLDKIHFCALSFYKIYVLIFNLVPWIALTLLR